MGTEYTHLKPFEREHLCRRRIEGASLRTIGQELGRDAGTVSREVARNRRRSGEYWPEDAQRKARARRFRGNRCERDAELNAYVRERLVLGWSPQQIAGRMRYEGHERPVSHETIYRFVYRPQGKRERLHRCLWRGKARRGYRAAKRPRGPRIPNWRSIHNRPRVANERRAFGHWEGDSMDFRTQKRPMLTLTERQTRFALAAERPDRTATEAAKAQVRLLAHLPAEARRSITYDNGSEFCDHETVTAATGMTAYFCDPHAPWQRGAIENVNRWLRRDLPRKIPLEHYAAEDLDDALWLYNTTPRKCLGYRTPLEAFSEKLGVALAD